MKKNENLKTMKLNQEKVIAEIILVMLEISVFFFLSCEMFFYVTTLKSKKVLVAYVPLKLNLKIFFGTLMNGKSSMI